jgi:hypothetical protein
MTMTRLILVGAVLVFSAIQLTRVSAQVSEPAAAMARDPNFSIYSSGPVGYGGSGAMAQAPLDDAFGPPLTCGRIARIM